MKKYKINYNFIGGSAVTNLDSRICTVLMHGCTLKETIIIPENTWVIYNCTNTAMVGNERIRNLWTQWVNNYSSDYSLNVYQRFDKLFELKFSKGSTVISTSTV